ncbi:MAG TPA: hypothetical protein VHM88_13240 [Candidatus Acidoferrales bacterium]|jgi:hypothetical protein|nr:hypothetical protein [Candidatus Acidoferrales bacterium]
MRNAAILILLLLALPPAGGQSSAPQAEAQVQKLWAEFEKTTWDAPLDGWSSLHADIPCERFRGNMWGSGADGQWCQRCSTNVQREAAHWSFYAFSLQEALVCRLERFDASTDSLPEETLRQVQQLLQAQVAARYAPGEDRTPTIARAVPWPQYVRWQAGDVEIQLNLSEFDPQRKEGRLSLVGRHRALLDALAEDDRLKKIDSSGLLYQVGSPIDVQLADELQKDFPDVATMLMQQRPAPDPEKMREAIQQLQTQLKSAPAAGETRIRAGLVAVPQTNWKAGEFHDALLRLLTTAKTSSPDRQAILLLAADRLAWRLPWVMTNDKSQAAHWAEWRAQLATFGVRYKQSLASPEENPWTFTGNLLREVWTDYAQSDWGERAFVLLLSQGWDTGVDCEAGSDQFRAVIQQGRKFLEQHPKSPYRLDVQLAVAQAYETLWSLSQAPTEEGYSDVEPAKYQKGANAARQKSIMYYEQILQAAPQSDQAAYARRELPRLRLSVDTGQRRFYCSIGD